MFLVGRSQQKITDRRMEESHHGRERDGRREAAESDHLQPPEDRQQMSRGASVTGLLEGDRCDEKPASGVEHDDRCETDLQRAKWMPTSSVL